MRKSVQLNQKFASTISIEKNIYRISREYSSNQTIEEAFCKLIQKINQAKRISGN